MNKLTDARDVKDVCAAGADGVWNVSTTRRNSLENGGGGRRRRCAVGVWRTRDWNHPSPARCRHRLLYYSRCYTRLTVLRAICFVNRCYQRSLHLARLRAKICYLRRRQRNGRGSAWLRSVAQTEHRGGGKKKKKWTKAGKRRRRGQK